MYVGIVRYTYCSYIVIVVKVLKAFRELKHLKLLQPCGLLKRTVKGSRNFGVDLFFKLEYTIEIVLILCMLAEKTAASDSVEDVAH